MNVSQPFSPHDASSLLERLPDLLVTLGGGEEYFHQLAQLAAGVTSTPLSCGITIRREDRPLTFAASDARAEGLDERQYEAKAGPCLFAMETGTVVSIPDTETELRWPLYLAAARKQGLKSSLSLPLIVRGVSLGAMNLYGFEHADTFTPDVTARCEVFAGQASGALHLASAAAQRDQALSQLEQTLQSRTVIDQAMGIVMAQELCSADEAFAVLRLRSQNSQRKLRDLAGDLVKEISGNPAQPGRGFRRS